MRGLRKRPFVVKKAEVETNETSKTQGPLLSIAPPGQVIPSPGLALFTLVGLRRVHDGVQWLYEACYFTLQGNTIVGVKTEPATSREIAEAKISRDTIALQFEKGPGMGKIPDSYFR